MVVTGCCFNDLLCALVFLFALTWFVVLFLCVYCLSLDLFDCVLVVFFVWFMFPFAGGLFGFCCRFCFGGCCFCVGFVVWWLF